MPRPLLLSTSICLMDHGGLDRGPCLLPTIHTLCHTHWMCYNSVMTPSVHMTSILLSILERDPPPLLSFNLIRNTTYFIPSFHQRVYPLFADERPEKRERESVPRLLRGLLHVCSGDGALLTGQPAGPAEERGRQIGLDVQVLAFARPHQGKRRHMHDITTMRPLWPSSPWACWYLPSHWKCGRLCFDRRVFIYLFIYLFVCVLFASHKKFKTESYWVGWLVIIRGPFD